MSPKNKEALKTTPLNLPEFRTMAEEREWWDTHHDEINEFIGRATKAGAVTRGQLLRSVEPTQQITIRLAVRDVERAKQMAGRKGLRYQSYVKMLLHEALEHAEKLG